MTGVQDVISRPNLLSRISLAVLVILALAGCATRYSPAADMIGALPEEVISRLGEPIPRPDSLEGVRRLDFPRGPYGKHTYIVYFGADGRAERFEQVLNETNFARIRPEMSTNEVRELIGVSRDTFLLGRDRGFVWNYRYITPLCQWFQIEFTKEGNVRSTGYGLPPECRRRLIGL
jgi:hypothetical protein